MGRDPLNSVKELFRVRNALVHPQPSNPNEKRKYAFNAYADRITGEDQESFGPKAVCGYLVNAGRFIVAVDPMRSTLSLVGQAELITKYHGIVSAYPVHIGPQIASVPERNAARPRCSAAG